MSEQPTNYRENRRKEERRLLYAVMAVLVLVGGGLIGLIWGLEAALLGLACLVSGAAMIGGLWLLLSLLQKLVDE